MDLLDFSILKQTINQMAQTFGEYIILVSIVGIISVIVLKFLKIPNVIARPLATVATLTAAYYGVGLIM